MASDISFFKFHGSMTTTSGRLLRKYSLFTIGILLPGNNLSCLFGLLSTTYSIVSVVMPRVFKKVTPFAAAQYAATRLPDFFNSKKNFKDSILCSKTVKLNVEYADASFNPLSTSFRSTSATELSTPLLPLSA